jgi:hypothetical protein
MVSAASSARRSAEASPSSSSARSRRSIRRVVPQVSSRDRRALVRSGFALRGAVLWVRRMPCITDRIAG